MFVEISSIIFLILFTSKNTPGGIAPGVKKPGVLIWRQ